jgi:hypothetical protein
VCHATDYQEAVRPDHQRVGFSTNCKECHGSRIWEEAHFEGGPLFDHNSFFPLADAHATAGCESCHQDGNFSSTPNDCFSCHQADFEATSRPDHLAAGFPTACETCHSEQQWEGATFDHDTAFRLTGAHRTATCESCHQNGQYQGTPHACASCHQADYDATSEPNHQGAGFPTACKSCHDTQQWEGATFDHDAVFRLTGAHRTATCESCHLNGQYQGTPRDCFSCHQTDYQATSDPNHQAAGFSTSCESCHGTSQWEGATVDHDAFFRLTGAHRTATCESCHLNGQYQGTPRDCFSCHQAEYNSTNDPNHQAAGFSTSCESCHNTNQWDGANFDHDAVFPLTGAHRNAICESCHLDGQYQGTPTDCFSCHQAEYSSTNDPNHQAAGFSTSCESCHDTNQWDGANFDHDAVFPLTGAHRNTPCDACHQNGQYQGTPTDCYSCHRSEYDGTNDPNHQAAGFSTSCESCHETNQWDGAIFDHDAVFPLTGAHRNTPCDACHQNGQFQGTPRDCYSCHRSDYDDTNDPNHQAAGFPTSCEGCHGTNRWDDATFDHAFDIERGPHGGLACLDCHVFSGNLQAFECILCHEHRQSEMDDEHSEEPGYVWESLACYSCHPTGRD